MREFKHSVNIIGIAVILLILVFAMLLTNREFFTQSKKASKDIYTTIDNEKHIIDLGAFKLTTPKDFYYLKEQGIDSYVGIITNEKDSIFFDYGMYSNPLDDPKFRRSYDTINGVKVITAYTDLNKIGIHFPKVIGENKLTMYGNFANKELAFDIYKTVLFPGKSGYTSAQLGANSSHGFWLGQQIFNQKCSACHALDMVIVGPSLSGVIDKKGINWFESWVRNPKELIRTNKEALDLYESHSELKHPSYNLSEKEMNNLIKYVTEEGNNLR